MSSVICNIPCRRNDGTSLIHKSDYNPNSDWICLSLRIKYSNGIKKTHHLFSDGTGTDSVGDKAE